MTEASNYQLIEMPLEIKCSNAQPISASISLIWFFIVNTSTYCIHHTSYIHSIESAKKQSKIFISIEQLTSKGK